MPIDAELLEILACPNCKTPVKLVKNGTLKVYPGLPHGMCTTQPELINRDLLAFIREQSLSTSPQQKRETV